MRKCAHLQRSCRGRSTVVQHQTLVPRATNTKLPTTAFLLFLFCVSLFGETKMSISVLGWPDRLGGSKFSLTTKQDDAGKERLWVDTPAQSGFVPVGEVVSYDLGVKTFIAPDVSWDTLFGEIPPDESQQNDNFREFEPWIVDADAIPGLQPGQYVDIHAHVWVDAFVMEDRYGPLAVEMGPLMKYTVGEQGQSIVWRTAPAAGFNGGDYYSLSGTTGTVQREQKSDEGYQSVWADIPLRHQVRSFLELDQNTSVPRPGVSLRLRFKYFPDVSRIRIRMQNWGGFNNGDCIVKAKLWATPVPTVRPAGGPLRNLRFLNPRRIVDDGHLIAAWDGGNYRDPRSSTEFTATGPYVTFGVWPVGSTEWLDLSYAAYPYADNVTSPCDLYALAGGLDLAGCAFDSGYPNDGSYPERNPFKEDGLKVRVRVSMLEDYSESLTTEFTLKYPKVALRLNTSIPTAPNVDILLTEAGTIPALCDMQLLYGTLPTNLGPRASTSAPIEVGERGIIGWPGFNVSMPEGYYQFKCTLRNLQDVPVITTPVFRNVSSTSVSGIFNDAIGNGITNLRIANVTALSIPWSDPEITWTGGNYAGTGRTDIGPALIMYIQEPGSSTWQYFKVGVPGDFGNIVSPWKWQDNMGVYYGESIGAPPDSFSGYKIRVYASMIDGHTSSWEDASNIATLSPSVWSMAQYTIP